MNYSDKEFLSRFSLDPGTEYSFEDIDGSYFSDDDEMDPFDNEKIPDSEDLILEDDFLFDN